MTTAPAFQLYLWSHRVLYVGVSPDNDLHRHHAAQLCVSLDGPLRFRADSTAPWNLGQGFLVPPDQWHQFETDQAAILALYLEPESDDYPIDDKLSEVQRLSLTDIQLDTLRSLLTGPIDADHAWRVCTSVFDFTHHAHRRLSQGDPRVQTVVERIRSQPSHPFTAAELAETVYLSPSRLSHVFKTQAGVPIRRFIVWSRLRTVVRHALQGATLTEAAHAAGFSDAAHMSNAFRQMFGFAPSALFAVNVAKEVVIVND